MKNLVRLQGGYKMWKRAELKRAAKQKLKGAWWKAFVVVFGMVVVSSVSNGLMNLFSERSVLVTFVISLLITLIVQSLAGYHLQVGGRRYFVQAAQGDINVKYLAYGFKGERFVPIVKSMLLVDVLVFAWSLLLVIPGIIKAHAYSMVPFILADNPEMDSKRAIQLSEQMTDGHKMDIFILGLSFFGWYFLAAFIGMSITMLTLMAGLYLPLVLMLIVGIAVLFIGAYQHAALAELYLILRQNVIEKELCDYRELNLVKELKETE